jgi:hypothetical protein
MGVLSSRLGEPHGGPKGSEVVLAERRDLARLLAEVGIEARP